MTETITNTAEKYVAQMQLLASAIAILAIVCTVLLYLIWRKTGIPRQLTGKQRLTTINWDLFEVFLAALLFFYIIDAMVFLLPWGKHKLPQETFALVELGEVIPVIMPAADGAPHLRLTSAILNAVGAMQTAPSDLARQVDDARTHMLYVVLLFPLILLLFLRTVKRLAGVRLYQIGLHLNRWRENFTLGTLVWLVITPLCTVILLIVLLDFWDTLWGRKASHALEVLLRQDPRITTWILVGLVTCVIAPVKEELVMRGIVQPYLMRNPLASDVLVVLSMVWAFTLLVTPGTGPDRGMGMGPLFYVAVIAPGYYLFEKWTERWITEPGAARGIFATSLFFATLHSPAWPQPIPLFLFSLAVGFLAYRTRSLVGPITVHALFNLTTMIMMILDAIPRFKW